MSAPSITPVLYTPRGEKMNHPALVKALGKDFVKAATTATARGGWDHVRLTLKITTGDGSVRTILAIKRVIGDSYTVEVGTIDPSTSIPVYTAVEQRADVSLDDLRQVCWDLYTAAAVPDVNVPDFIPDDFA